MNNISFSFFTTLLLYVTKSSYRMDGLMAPMLLGSHCAPLPVNNRNERKLPEGTTAGWECGAPSRHHRRAVGSGSMNHYLIRGQLM